MELDELWAPAGEQGVELSQDSDGEERGESGRATGEWILPVGGDLTPGSGIPGSRNDCSDLLADSMSDDLVLLPFSGHGLKSDSGELFFATRNTRPDRLGSTAVSADARLGRSRSHARNDALRLPRLPLL